MNYFECHKVKETSDGIIIELYLSEELCEFSKEFSCDKYKNQSNSKRTLLKNASKYIESNIPNIKAKTVSIIAGSIIVASIPFSTINVEAINIPSINQYQDYEIHTVKLGDTLYKIANRYGITINDIKELNGLKSDMIFIGQSLKIPSFKQFYYTYYVKSGDMLYKIAQNFNTNIDSIKSINNLSSNNIYPGQKLRILKQQDVYTVKQNDVLYKIAQKYNVTVFQLKAANNISGYMINVGQKLNIPDSILFSDKPNDVLVLVNKKYSLSSEYVPDNLVVPKISFSFEGYNPKKQMRKDAAFAIEELFNKANEDNIKLFAVSGYRSYDRQESIFTSKVMKIGIQSANQFSAKPGESEHQTGLSMDVTSPSVGYYLSQKFGETKEGKWLKENAADYGFIIRYPKGKTYITGYQYEPWHIRYVGKNAAKYISNNNITLEEYLGLY